MDGIYIFLLVIIGFVFLYFIIAKTFLPDKYSELKQKYPCPLHSYSWLLGYFKFELFFQMWPLKIDVYEKMIIVSALGQGVCLPYDKYIFEHKKFLYYPYLVVKTLPEFGEYQEETETILKIALSVDEINTILSLAHK